MNLLRTPILICHEREKLKTLDRHPNAHHENRGYAALQVLEDFLELSKLLERAHHPELRVLDVCKVKEGKCKLLTLGNMPGDEKSFEITVVPFEWPHAARIRVVFPDSHGMTRTELQGLIADYNRLRSAEIFQATRAPRQPVPKKDSKSVPTPHHAAAH